VVFFSSFASQVWHPSYRYCALPWLDIPDLGRVLRAIKGLHPQERKKLKSLLIEYQDVFAKHDLDLGCLTTVKHNIDTKDATPTVFFLSFTYWLLSFTRLTGQTFPVHKLLAMRTLVIGTGSIMKLHLNVL
jgi:hypothetical protein